MSDLDRGAVIGYLASVSAEERREIDREVWKILAEEKKSAERQQQREGLRVIEEALASAGTRALGLAIGGADRVSRYYVRGVWPHKRARHLLLPHGGHLLAACRGEDVALDRLSEIKLDLAVPGAGPCCAACMEARPRKQGRGIWAPQGPYRRTQSLTATELAEVVL